MIFAPLQEPLNFENPLNQIRQSLDKFSNYAAIKRKGQWQPLSIELICKLHKLPVQAVQENQIIYISVPTLSPAYYHAVTRNRPITPFISWCHQYPGAKEWATHLETARAVTAAGSVLSLRSKAVCIVSLLRNTSWHDHWNPGKKDVQCLSSLLQQWAASTQKAAMMRKSGYVCYVKRPKKNNKKAQFF